MDLLYVADWPFTKKHHVKYLSDLVCKWWVSNVFVTTHGCLGNSHLKSFDSTLSQTLRSEYGHNVPVDVASKLFYTRMCDWQWVTVSLGKLKDCSILHWFWVSRCKCALSLRAER